MHFQRVCCSGYATLLCNRASYEHIQGLPIKLNISIGCQRQLQFSFAGMSLQYASNITGHF